MTEDPKEILASMISHTTLEVIKKSVGVRI